MITFSSPCREIQWRIQDENGWWAQNSNISQHNFRKFKFMCHYMHAYMGMQENNKVASKQSTGHSQSLWSTCSTFIFFIFCTIHKVPIFICGIGTERSII
jgi:hypothetical protein